MVNYGNRISHKIRAGVGESISLPSRESVQTSARSFQGVNMGKRVWTFWNFRIEFPVKEISEKEKLRRAAKELLEIDEQAERIKRLVKAYIDSGVKVAVAILLSAQLAHAEPITASYYTVESCAREGTSGIMANGYPLRDDLLACASWDYGFSTILRVTNINNGRSVIVYVADRGPAKKLYKKGRKIDLTKRAFEQIAPLCDGVIPVKIEMLRGGNS
jgi:rare lipoprotein A (peptidoglycan hydrolase)